MEEKRNGEFVGAFPSYGYIKNPEDNHKLIIDEESAEIVRKIFEWKVNEGIGNLSICHRLNDRGVLNPTGYKKKKLNQNYNIQIDDHSEVVNMCEAIQGLIDDGVVKGIQSEKRETALRLSKMGLSIKQIAQATELSEDDVLKLIQK